MTQINKLISFQDNIFPEWPDKFYKQFIDPFRAYNSLPFLYAFFKDRDYTWHQTDHISYASALAHYHRITGTKDLLSFADLTKYFES